MAITVVGTPQAGAASNGGDVTLTFDGTPQEGDCVVLIGGNADGNGSGDVGPSTAGYTQQHLHQANDGSNLAGGIWTKFLGATPDTQVVGLGSGVAQEATAYTCIVLRGVDETTPMDASVVEVGPGAEGESDPDPGAITTVTDDAWVIASGVMGTDNTASAPTGYSNLASAGAVDTRRCAAALATKEVTTAGSEDPGPFTWSNNASGFYWVWTAAIRPAGAGGGGTTVTPSTVAATVAVPTPTPSGAASVSPATVAATAAVPAPAPEGEAATTPSAVAATADVPTPATAVGKTVTPSVIPTVAAFPTPTPLGEAVVSVSVIAATASLPTPSASTGVVALPDTIEASAALAAPSAEGQAAVSPSVVVASVALPTPNPAGEVAVSPSTFTVVVALPASTVAGGALVTPAVINAAVAVLEPSITGVELNINALAYYQFHRINGNLVLAPVGRSARRGFRTGEGFERVSDIIRMDQDPSTGADPDSAMEAVASAWAAHSGSDAATLKAQIHSALQVAGWRAQGGGDLT